MCKDCIFWQHIKLHGKCKFMDFLSKSYLYPSFPHYTTFDHTCPKFKQKENEHVEGSTVSS
jgi:hypothetical protein